MQYLFVAIIILLSACSTKSTFLAPQLDLSSLECGYKWFQSGYSKTLAVEDCTSNRTALRQTLEPEAKRAAWDAAKARCPVDCPPVQLPDTVEWDNPEPNGACRNGFVYFLDRVFFQCGE